MCDAIGKNIRKIILYVCRKMNLKTGKNGIRIIEILLGKVKCFMENKYYDELVKVRMQRTEELESG